MISLNDIVRINDLTLILKIISQCDGKHIIMLPIETIMLVFKVSTYIITAGITISPTGQVSTYIITAGITISPTGLAVILPRYNSIENITKKNSVEQWLVFLAKSVKHHVFDLPLDQAKGHKKGYLPLVQSTHRRVGPRVRIKYLSRLLFQ